MRSDRKTVLVLSAASRKRGEFADLKVCTFFHDRLVPRPVPAFTLGQAHFQTGDFGAFSRRR